MKILIATGIFIPEVGGPATYADRIAREFLKLGHAVKILSYADKDSYDFDAELPYSVLRIKRTNKLFNYWRYYKAVKKIGKNCDVIYAFDHFSAGLPAILANRFLRKPFYVRVGGDFIWERYLDKHEESLVTLVDFYKNNLSKKFENFRFKVIKWIFKESTGIIFTTAFQKDIFQKYYNLPTDKLAVINNPRDQVGKNIVRRQPTKEIIFFGRFNNKNNLLNLIQAFQNIKDKTFSLVIIGEGPLQDKLERKIKELNLNNIKIEFRLATDPLKKRIANAYAVIFPSLTDISPNGMLMALGLNIPILSSREIGFNWLEDKLIFFNPLDLAEMTEKINKLLDPDYYQRYSKAIAELSYDYSYTQAAQDTINIFKK